MNFLYLIKFLHLTAFILNLFLVNLFHLLYLLDPYNHAKIVFLNDLIVNIINTKDLNLKYNLYECKYMINIFLYVNCIYCN